MFIQYQGQQRGV